MSESRPKSREEQVEDVFLEQVRQGHPRLEFMEGDGMITIAKSLCTAYDNGATSTEVNDFLLQSAGPAYELMELVSIHGAGLAAFCPEHVSKLG